MNTEQNNAGAQLSDGSIVSKEDGVSMAKAGQIKGVGVAHSYVQ